MRKLLIDTDAGIDDSVAILYAGSMPDVEIVAITTVYGTATVDNTTQNVLNLTELMGLDTRVAKGRAAPLLLEPGEMGVFHGPTGVGDATFPVASKKADDTYAWDVMYQEAKKAGKLTIVTLGPLSNLALALLKYDDLPNYLDKIVIMGGSLDNGNAFTFGEANIMHDPHACEIVFRSGANIVMAGLNATETTRMTTEEWNYTFSRRTKLWRVLRDMFGTYKQSQNRSGETGLVIHDAAAMVAALQENDATGEKLCIHCETTPGPMYARTVADLRHHIPTDKNVFALTNIDKKAFLSAMDNMLAYYEE